MLFTNKITYCTTNLQGQWQLLPTMFIFYYTILHLINRKNKLIKNIIKIKKKYSQKSILIKKWRFKKVLPLNNSLCYNSDITR